MKQIHVVAGIIFSSDRASILIAKRPDHLHQGGLWEFPGGKVAASESVQEALVRELREELDIQLLRAEPYCQISHKYPDKAVFLDFWSVTDFAGEPKGVEGQEVRWVALHELAAYDFPAANVPVVERLLIPRSPYGASVLL